MEYITDFRDFITVINDSNDRITKYWGDDFSGMAKNYEEVFEFVKNGVQLDNVAINMNQDIMNMNFWAWEFWFPRVADSLGKNHLQAAKYYFQCAVNGNLCDDVLDDLKEMFPLEKEFLEYAEEALRDQVHAKPGPRKPKKILVNGKYKIAFD